LRRGVVDTFIVFAMGALTNGLPVKATSGPGAITRAHREVVERRAAQLIRISDLELQVAFSAGAVCRRCISK
jgi:hypothetical protein